MPLTRPSRAARVLLVLGLAAGAGATGTAAQAITGRSRVVATYADWRVVIGDTNRGKVCYAAGSPRLRMPQGAVRERAYLFVTTRPEDSVRDEVSVEFGFDVAAGASLTVGTEDFPLANDGRGAWIRDIPEEARLVAAMRAQAQLTVRSVSQLGEDTIDTYSLKGFGDALNHARRECADPNSTSALPVPHGKPA